MIDFEVQDPIAVPLTRAAAGRLITKEDIKAFWALPAAAAVAGGVGCYVFAIRAGRGYTPYYVGKATKTFKQEVFTPHKLNRYHETLVNVKKGTPVLFFVKHPIQKGKNNARVIKAVEDFLIATAAATNPELVNVKGTKPPKWTIKGVLRSKAGKPSKSARSFKSCMGL